MKRLASISEITEKDVIDTRTKPLRVMASDYNFYLCKHSRSSKADTLFNEFLAASFLQQWQFSVPDFVLVDISRHHIHDSVLCSEIRYSNFEKPTIGFTYLEHALHINDFMTYLSRQKKLYQILNKRKDILKILLFDLWLSNEDRSPGNMNLLINPSGGTFQVIPIDHEFIFNSNMNPGTLTHLAQEETIAGSKFFKLFLPKQKYTKIVEHLDLIKSDFISYVDVCEQNMDIFIHQLPSAWNISIAEKQQWFQLLFSQNWIEETFQRFTEYIALTQTRSL